MIHTGSRGFGHQVATDYIEIMQEAMKKYNILGFSIDHVFLHLRHVVRHVIDDIHFHVFWVSLEHTLETVPYPVSDDLSVRETEISCGSHCTHVILSLLGIKWC